MQTRERIILQTSSTYNPYRMGGTLKAWQDNIGRWARGNSRLQLAISIALAGPLLYLSGQESGGFHYYGGSSTGKTTSLSIAASPWGKGSTSDGFIRSWRATANGLEAIAALHNDTLLCLDEMGQTDPRTVAEAIYLLANEQGKSRANRNGLARPAQSWRVLIMSTGETPAATKISENGGKHQAGQAVRLIDIPADAGAGLGLFEDIHGHESAQAFADALKREASTNYGYLSRAYLQKLVDLRVEVIATLQQGIADGLKTLCPHDVDGQVKRVAKRFLLAALAGELATEWGLLPWEPGDSLQAAKVCFDAWLGQRGGTGAHEDTAILSQVRLFIEQHGSSRFQDLDRPEATCINRAGFRRSQDDQTTYYILPESFKEVVKGHTPARAAKVLKDAGLLQADGRNLKRRGPNFPGLGRAICYVLSFSSKEVENELD